MRAVTQSFSSILVYPVWPVVVLPSPPCSRAYSGWSGKLGANGSRAISLVTKSVTLSPLASGESLFSMSILMEWTMATLLSNQISSNQAKISSLF